MTNNQVDLIILAADPTMQRTIRTLLEHRREALGISSFSVDVQAHRNRDPGCRTAAGDVLNPARHSHRKALVVFDFHGCGENHRSASQLESMLEQQFKDGGWEDDSIAFVVIEPELEAWLFGAPFRRIEDAIGWSQATPLKEWMISNGHLSAEQIKPRDPQTAIDAALQLQKEPRTSRMFANLARTVSLAHCQDRAFRKFRVTLQRWFPAQ